MEENNNGWFGRYVMSLSFKERRAKELQKYRQRIHELRNMKTDEREFEYITLKSRYEHKKSTFSIFLISIALALLMNVWKCFFLFLRMALQYASSFKGSEIEIIKVSFTISVIVAVSISFLIAVILITYAKDIYQIHKELLIVMKVLCLEEWRNKNEKNL